MGGVSPRPYHGWGQPQAVPWVGSAPMGGVSPRPYHGWGQPQAVPWVGQPQAVPWVGSAPGRTMGGVSPRPYHGSLRLSRVSSRLYHWIRLCHSQCGSAVIVLVSCSDAKNLEDFDSKGWVGRVLVGKDVHLTSTGC